MNEGKGNKHLLLYQPEKK